MAWSIGEPAAGAPVTDEEISAAADDEELLRIARDWFRRDREHSAEWRREAREDYDFFAGRQWDEESIRILQEQGRPCITFNRVQPIINAVIGLEIQNRQEVRYIPRTEGDVKPNEVLTSAVQWLRDQTDADNEDSAAFQDDVVGGMGWTETRLDWEEDPEGKAIVERVDPFEMFWDRSARKRNLTDARRFWRVRRDVPRSEVRTMFPEADDEALDASWALGREHDGDEPHDADPRNAYQQEDLDDERGDRRGTVTLVHLQWWERETYFRTETLIPSADGISPPQAERQDVSEADLGVLQERLSAIGGAVKATRMTRRVYRQAWLGSKVLKREDSLFERAFSWKCITGIPDQNKGTFHGLVRPLKDPQRWANKWLSQTLHIINTNAKGGIMAEKTAFDDPVAAEQEWSDPQKITWVKAGALSAAAPKIMQKQQPVLPTGIERLMEFAITSMRDSVGVNLELLGMRDAAQAGVLEAQRKQAGMTILASLFDSLRLYRKLQGELMLECVEKYLGDGRLIRIVGEEQARYVPLVMQPGVARYDVIVDDAPTSTNQKEQVWGVLLALLPQIGGAMPPDMMLTLLEYSPLPSTVVEKLKEQAKAAQASAAQQPNPEQVKAQAQMQQIQAKTAADQQKAMLDQQTQQVKAQSEAELAERELQVKTRELALQEQEAAMKESLALSKHQMDMQKLAARAAMPPKNSSAGT